MVALDVFHQKEKSFHAFSTLKKLLSTCIQVLVLVKVSIFLPQNATDVLRKRSFFFFWTPLTIPYLKVSRLLCSVSSQNVPKSAIFRIFAESLDFLLFLLVLTSSRTIPHINKQ